MPCQWSESAPCPFTAASDTLIEFEGRQYCSLHLPLGSNQKENATNFAARFLGTSSRSRDWLLGSALRIRAVVFVPNEVFSQNFDFAPDEIADVPFQFAIHCPECRFTRACARLRSLLLRLLVRLQQILDRFPEASSRRPSRLAADENRSSDRELPPTPNGRILARSAGRGFRSGSMPCPTELPVTRPKAVG
jgi:hypothetical protein